MDLSVIPYKHVAKCENGKENNDDDVVEEDKAARRFDKEGGPVVMNPKATVKTVGKYKECMRNHAASMGGHASDGCGEFMPSGGGDPRESLTCAACGCHRNFHRREVHSPRLPTTMLLYNAGPAVAYRHHHYGGSGGDRRSETPERVGPTASVKRFRTKFTQEQKDRMLEFAERIGWRIQRHDDVELNQFCSEVGVKRNVLKVWMHNNKNAHRRKEDAQQSPPAPQPVGV
jgi:ZF-HD class homeobox domain-containing protein